MKFVRLGPAGSEIPGLVHDDGQILDLRPVTSDIDGAFLANGGIDAARRALPTLPPLPDAGQLRIGAPVARPSAIVCIGQNYAAHARESGAEPPTEPVIFFKHPNTLVGPGDEILIPRGSTKTDWEVELAVVLGARARYLRTREEALACVGGYSIANDVSERALQLETSGGQWSKGKCCETFNPMGPHLITPDEIEPSDLHLRSSVNCERRQDSTTADMIFDVAEIILRLSHVMVLEPGDIINTGTPEGVALSGRFPYLSAGDVVTCEIDGIGAIEQRVGQA